MKKHDWELDQGMYSEFYIIMCRGCGISYFGRPKTEAPEFINTSCPPWDSQGRGDINAKRVYEVGVVQELKLLLQDIMRTASFKTEAKALSIYKRSNKLIQKLEDQAGG